MGKQSQRAKPPRDGDDAARATSTRAEDAFELLADTVAAAVDAVELAAHAGGLFFGLGLVAAHAAARRGLWAAACAWCVCNWTFSGRRPARAAAQKRSSCRRTRRRPPPRGPGGPRRARRRGQGRKRGRPRGPRARRRRRPRRPCRPAARTRPPPASTSRAPRRRRRAAAWRADSACPSCFFFESSTANRLARLSRCSTWSASARVILTGDEMNLGLIETLAR